MYALITLLPSSLGSCLAGITLQAIQRHFVQFTFAKLPLRTQSTESLCYENLPAQQASDLT